MVLCILPGTKYRVFFGREVCWEFTCEGCWEFVVILLYLLLLTLGIGFVVTLAVAL